MKTTIDVIHKFITILPTTRIMMRRHTITKLPISILVRIFILFLVILEGFVIILKLFMNLILFYYIFAIDIVFYLLLYPYRPEIKKKNIQ